MDQIRKALGWLKRFHFWVLSVVVAFVALGCWYTGTGTLSKEFAANKSAITGAFTAVEGVSNEPFKPNSKIADGQTVEIEKQMKNVEAVWKQLWEAQRENVLKWPTQLSQSFRDHVASRKFGDDIPPNLRANYSNYIDRHFEELPKIVGAYPIPADTAQSGGYGGSRGYSGREGGYGSGMGMGTGAAGGVDPDDYLCNWDEADQVRVRQELDFPTSPSALRIWVTQENLWVYHTLLNVIAKTNEAKGTDRMSNAAVQIIMSLQVGRDAAPFSREKGRVEILQAPSAGGDAMAEGGDSGGMMPGGEGGAPAGGEYGGRSMGMGGYGGEGAAGGQMTPEQESAFLLGGRYLDDQGMPIGGGMSVSPEGGDPAADPSGGAPVTVDNSAPFKRLPVRMVLQMDQRWITHLIAKCASQPLQVEVTEVRINPAAVAGGMSGMGGMGGMGGGYGGPSRGSYGPPGGGESRGSYGPGGGMGGMGSGASAGGSSIYQPPIAPGEIRPFKQNPSLATVVVQGIIYIFNEPDASKLKPAESAEQVAATE